MALVVEPTHPYSNQQLQLDNPSRWSALFPLMRPSTQREVTASGQSTILDTALAASKYVLIAVIGAAGKISSRTLSDSHLAAFATEQSGQSHITSDEVLKLLKDRNFPVKNGVVIVRLGQRRDLSVGSGHVELVLDDELAIDHVLSLLNTSKEDLKASFDKTRSLLEHFAKSAVSTVSQFHPEKTGSGPRVVQATGTEQLKTAKEAIAKDLQHLLSSKQDLSKDLVLSIHYSDINGLSRLEINIIAHEIYSYIKNQGLQSRITHSTILNHDSHGRGFAISLCPLDSSFLSPQSPPTATLSSASTPSVSTTTAQSRSGPSNLTFPSPGIRNIITAGCETVIKSEPTITEYDTIVGDGDCGYTLRDGATQVMKFIGTTTDADLSSSLPSTLTALVDDLEVNMGGTSGALYCIFLSALAQHLKTASTFAEALKGALEQLLKYTTARLGDRTCLDCLIPFVETLLRVGDGAKALEEARKGVDGTMKMEARVGRSSYLDESATRGVPDPGAYGLLKLLEGMVGAA